MEFTYEMFLAVIHGGPEEKKDETPEEREKREQEWKDHIESIL